MHSPLLCPAFPSWCAKGSLLFPSGLSLCRCPLLPAGRQKASLAHRQHVAAYCDRPATGHPHHPSPGTEQVVLLGNPHSLETCVVKSLFAPNLAEVLDISRWSYFGALFWKDASFPAGSL